MCKHRKLSYADSGVRQLAVVNGTQGPIPGDVLDFILNSGKGEPGYEFMCILRPLGLIEELCESSNANNQARALLTNDPGEGDVLAEFKKAETINSYVPAPTTKPDLSVRKTTAPS
jgi:hypothetical protein